MPWRSAHNAWHKLLPILDGLHGDRSTQSNILVKCKENYGLFLYSHQFKSVHWLNTLSAMTNATVFASLPASRQKKSQNLTFSNGFMSVLWLDHTSRRLYFDPHNFTVILSSLLRPLTFFPQGLPCTFASSIISTWGRKRVSEELIQWMDHKQIHANLLLDNFVIRQLLKTNDDFYQTVKN